MILIGEDNSKFVLRNSTPLDANANKGAGIDRRIAFLKSLQKRYSADDIYSNYEEELLKGQWRRIIKSIGREVKGKKNNTKDVQQRIQKKHIHAVQGDENITYHP